MSPLPRSTPPALVLVAVSCLVALVVRLPALGARSLSAPEQRVLVESQGLDPWAPLPEDEPLGASSFPRRPAATSPGFSAGLSLWGRTAGLSEVSLRLPSALAGAVTAALVAATAASLAGPWAAGVAGLLVALSPIHALASREAGHGATSVLLVALGLGLTLRVARDGGTVRAVGLGVLLGLMALGSPALLGLAVLNLGALATRPGPRRPAVLAAGSAALVIVLAGGAGWLRSPLVVEPGLGWVPETTALGVVRCAGASFTRVAGLDYHLVVSHARWVGPVPFLVVALAVWGASRVEAQRRWLLLGGAALPFALGIVLAVATGTVAPLQAHRMLPALPFLAVLVGTGVAALDRRRAVATAGVVLGGAGLFLALALTAQPRETSPTRALAREVTRCRPAGAVVSVQRPLDAFALAAWKVPGPLWLRSPHAPPPPEPGIRIGPPATCVEGGPACPGVPSCPSEPSSAPRPGP